MNLREHIRVRLAKHENLFTLLWYMHLVRNENPKVQLMNEKMYTAIFLVTLRLPVHIDPKDARNDLKTCISFGNPVIDHPLVIPDPDPE